jgi:predicted dehydrogenase
MTASLNIGILGAGSIAQLAHLPVLSRTKNATLAALCDNDGPKARALADRFDIPDVYTDIEDMLDAEELDALVITTPNHLHEPHVMAALANDVHVLCERPLSLTAKGVERILAAANRSGKMVAVANNHRFRTDVQGLAGFLRGGELGKLRGVRAGAYHQPRPLEGWRLRRAESGGGAFFEHGFPLLDLAMWLADFPEPTRVVAQMERARGANAVEENMVVQMECAAGIVLVIDVRWNYIAEKDRWWFEVIGTRGSARLAPLRVVKELNGRPVDVTPSGAAARESPFIQSYRAELAHFLAVLRGEVGYEPPSDQLLVHRIAEAIYKAAEDGKEVRL